jgi:hypothetical protein
MAGEHAVHFVPERLPWQVLKGMTRVLQLCWGYSAVMALLKELNVYQVDFQQHPAHERRLCSASQWMFEQREVEWPHGSFFRPQSIFCDNVGENTLLIGSPFALYSAATAAPQRLQLSEVDRSRMPPSTIIMCNPETPQSESFFSSCIFSAPVERGIAFWPMGSSHWGANTTTLSVDGTAWQQLAGGVVRCKTVERLLAHDDSSMTWCLMLAGWDGDMLPIAVVPLPERGMVPAAGVLVRPSLDAPLRGDKSTESGKKERQIVTMHLEARSGRLWAIKGDGKLEMWDLLRSQSLGSSKLPKPSGAVNFKPAALCASSESSRLYVVGRSDTAGPTLFSTPLRDPAFQGQTSFRQCVQVA